MRVTNGMMRTNSMLNMQKNKIAYDKYLQQYNTQKKIQRPSDDPTIAVRALKYRTTLVEIEQYQRNIEDATSWMDATETAIKDVDKVMDNMVQYVTQAATGTVNAKDREDINKQLDQYAQYIYEQDMNADYAGRYLFTGYRTDSPMLFDKAQDNVTYTIH
ncbi:MAG: flagellar hook-associated protein 3, partial [Eubacterium sp.]|nr:flagellar hook-associated protein 3 [Eubacterium sp.]